MQTTEEFLVPSSLTIISRKRMRQMDEKEIVDMRNRRRLAVQKHRKKIKDNIVRLEVQLNQVRATNHIKEKEIEKLKVDINEKIGKIVRDPDLLQKTMQALQQFSTEVS